MKRPISIAERRSRTRLPANYPVRITSPHCEAEPGWVVDLSFGGMFVSCSSVEPPGTPVELQLSVPGMGEGLALRGRVAWIAPGRSEKGPGMGIALER